MPEYIERYFLQAYNKVSTNKDIQKRTDERLRIEHVPAKLRREDDRKFHRQYGYVKKAYPGFTFRKEMLDSDDPSRFELFSPGHPLFESVLEETLKDTLIHLEKGAVFQDPETEKPYYLWFVEAAIRDGLGREISRRIFAIKQIDKGNMQTSGAFILHDLKPMENGSLTNTPGQKPLEKKEIIGYFLGNVSGNFLGEVREERLHEMEVKEKYLTQSFKVLTNRSNEKLMKYDERSAKGEDMVAAIRQEKTNLKNIKQRRDERLAEVVKEKQIYPIAPEIIGLVRVLPMLIDDPQLKAAMHRDDEVERIAMEKAIAYEESQGRIPEDVSNQNLGFDIRSIAADSSEVRYIEVKGRAKDGAIALTPNEWVKADRLQHLYWLYIVTECKIEPKLHIIQDPFNNIEVMEEKTVVRYLADAKSWKKAAK